MNEAKINGNQIFFRNLGWRKNVLSPHPKWKKWAINTSILHFSLKNMGFNSQEKQKIKAKLTIGLKFCNLRKKMNNFRNFFEVQSKTALFIDFPHPAPKLKFFWSKFFRWGSSCGGGHPWNMPFHMTFTPRAPKNNFFGQNLMSRGSFFSLDPTSLGLEKIYKGTKLWILQNYPQKL